jgi:polyhydroxybutyrate depolymerase
MAWRGSGPALALFPGGHGVPDGWADLAADWLENLPVGDARP